MAVNESSGLLYPARDKLKETNTCCSARYTFIAVTAVGLSIAYFLRFNLSVAMVAMVSDNVMSNSSVKNSSHSSLDCPRTNITVTNRTTTGQFDWDPRTQGFILSSFFYGYCVLQIPGAWLSTRYGAKMVIGLSILIMSLLTLLTPLAARTHMGLLIAVRAAEGLAGGALFPSVHTMVGCWALENERSKMVSLIGVGPFTGIVVAFLGTGWLCDQSLLGGWPLAFYIPGALGCLWFIAWMFLVYSSPSKHPRISKEELNLIVSSIGENVYDKMPIPWLSILTSGPFWAICVAFTCSAWGSYTLLTELPSYMKEVIGVNISQNGLLSALPFAASTIVTVCWGFIADFMLGRKYLSVTTVRKLMNLLASLGPAAFLILVNFVGCNPYFVAAAITGATCFQVADGAGNNPNMIDIAPHLAGLIKSICNTFATLTGIVAPYLAGVIVNDGETRAEWSKVYYITAGVFVFDAIVYSFLASGNLQPWATVVKDVEILPDKRRSNADENYGSVSSGEPLWAGDIQKSR